MDLNTLPTAIRQLARALILLGALGAGVAAADPCQPGRRDCDNPPAQAPAPSPARTRIDGLAELHFNARAGRFTVTVTGAQLASDREAVNVFVNDRLLPAESVFMSRHAIEVDYQFDAGLNEVLVTAPDTEGREVRADGLYWAGGAMLVVDVTDDDLNPLDGVAVTVRLGQASTVRAGAFTQGGTARFANLPNAMLVVEAVQVGYAGVRATTTGGSGPLLLMMSRDGAVASFGQ